MKFIDEAIITIQSGDGGGGCVGFRREKFVPKGGPDGGDGGKGGDVIFRASSQKRTLYRFRHQRHFKAQRGGNGQGRLKSGKNGDSLIIELPVGTIISDMESGEILHDFVDPEDTFIAAKGGRGGKGNKHFATSTHRTPRFAQPGESGQTLKLRLELKLLADVGIFGFPNAGKSTLISSISAARPKIADYPFTTLTPTLGMVVPGPDTEAFAVADIPGLIEGAHTGAGLGTQFLRHIERTRLLVHLIDASTIETEDPLRPYNAINTELARHSRNLSEKPQLIVLNKLDLPNTSEAADHFESAIKGQPVLRISAATGQGVQQLKWRLAQLLDEHDADKSQEIC